MWELGTAQATGVRFSYAVAGSGPPLILLPGAGGWQLTFADLGAVLARSRQVLAVDPPGQGRTRITDSAARFDADGVAHALEEFVAALGLTDVDVVGHSWGGGFALRLSQLHPHRVRRLVLLAPAGLVVPDAWSFALSGSRCLES